MALKGDPATWSGNDRQSVIRDALAASAERGSGHVPGTFTDENGKRKRKCKTCRAAARRLFHQLGEEPLIYTSGTPRRPLPKGTERWERFMNNVGEIHAYVVAGDFSDDAPSEAPATPEPTPEPSEAPEASETPTTPPYVPPTPSGLLADAERFYTAVQVRRAFVRGRKGMESLDSMRVIIEGVKALKMGLPVEALISAIEAPWTAETRAQAAAYRPTASELKPVIPAGTYDYASFAPRPSKFAHATSEYVARLVAANVPVWLHGPAGTGKSSAARYAADQAGLKYYEVNLSGAMASAVKGRDRLKEFVESDAMRALEHGGLLCLEEFSGAHPSVGTALNTMLAISVGDAFHNDAADRAIVKHPDFRVVVTDNSLGYGSAEFKRNALDAATLDRFRVGRVYQGLDLGLERNIFDSILAA